MLRTTIEWVRNPDGNQGFSCNPIAGLCPVGCWYCYGKKFVLRFKTGKEIRFYPGGLHKILYRKKPAGIFMCSTFELFHPITNTEITKGYTWRDQIFDVIKTCPQHRFYILTKLPQNIDRLMPPNVWLGCSITKTEEANPNLKALYCTEAKLKFISFEPLFEDVCHKTDFPFVAGEFDWIIVGRLTGYGHKHDPDQFWLEKIIMHGMEYSIPVFLKNNLIPILGEKFVKEHQEMPKEQP